MDLGYDAIVTAYWTANGQYSINGESISNADVLSAENSITFTGVVQLFSTDYSSVSSYITFEAPHIIFSNLGTLGIAIIKSSKNKLTFNNSSVNFDNVAYMNQSSAPPSFPEVRGQISFTGTSSINVTPNTKGKTIIKASTLTGTVFLNVESGVQDGDTFLIEATDNQLVITDGDWIATPSTSGKITTYTLSKAAVPKPKFRMLYTIGG